MIDFLIQICSRMRAFFQWEPLDRELDAEMASHLELAIEENVQQGMSPEAARRRALVEFGGLQQARERQRAARGLPFLEVLGQDLRFALRQLNSNRGFTATAVLMLTLGVGASVAIFAFVDAALIQPLPYPHPNQLVDVTESLTLFPRSNLSYPDYLDWQRMNTVFTSLDAYGGTGDLLQTSDGAVPISGTRVSAGFLRTLGVRPELGRDFVPGDDTLSSPRTMLLTWKGWQKLFGGRGDVIGLTIQLSGEPVTIIGVLPATFVFAPLGDPEYLKALPDRRGCDPNRSCHSLNGVGRLKEGVTVAAALANMKTIAAQLEREYPDSNRGQSASVMPLAKAITGDIRPILLVFLGGAALLLLIACVNVSNLLLVRSEKRRRELALRGALGASRVRLVRQFVTEALALVLTGTGFGLLLADATMRILRGMISKDLISNMPFLDGLGLTTHVWLFAALVAALAAALFSIVPILRMPLANLRDGLHDGGRGSAGNLWRRLGAHLVIVELAIAVILLTGAGLLVKSFWRLLQVDLGFNPNHLAMASVELSGFEFQKEAQQEAFANTALERVRMLPGVADAALTTVPPVTCNCDTDWIRFVGKPYNGVHNEVNDRQVSAGFFHTIQAQLSRGRLFTGTDDAAHPKVIIVNEAFAQKYFPGEDPIGRMIGDIDLKPDSLRKIVGVVVNIRDGALDADEWPTEHESFAQDPSTYFSLVVRARGDERTLLPEIEAAVRQVSPAVGVTNETTMTTRIQDSSSAWLHRSAATLVGGFAGLALLLSIVGLYGVIAYSVSQRTREIGVRMALGAQRSVVHRLILREAAWLVAVGVAAGLVCSVAAASLMRSLLFGVRAWDIPTLAAVTAALTVAALLAAYLPARRASQIDPMIALRTE
ncbi:MAG: ABC transporter permease [Acidobacteriaceae bacterium]